MYFGLEEVGWVYFRLELSFGLGYYCQVLLNLLQVFQILLQRTLDRQHQL